MPQLDKVTFLSQFFWLVFFFFGFYIFQLKYFLPEVSRILKFRKKTLNQSSAFTLQEENSKVGNSVSTVLENLFKNGNHVFKSSSSTSDNWFSDFAVKLNQNNFKKSNRKYFQSIAEKSLSNNLTMLAVHDSLEKDRTAIAAGHQNVAQTSSSTKSSQFACGTTFSSKLLKHLLSISQKSFSLKSRHFLTALEKQSSRNSTKEKTALKTSVSENTDIKPSQSKLDQKKSNSIDKEKKSTKKKKN